MHVLSFLDECLVFLESFVCYKVKEESFLSVYKLKCEFAARINGERYRWYGYSKIEIYQMKVPVLELW